jgi:HlyD family secretion protein
MMKLTEPLTPPFSGPAGTTQRPRRRAWISGAAAVALLGVGAIGYTQFRGSPSVAPSSSAEQAPIEVKTVHAVRQVIRKVIEQPGRVEAYEQTPIFVKIAGFVQEWKTDKGAIVKQGDVLAVLSVPEEVEELKRREATAALATAEVVAAEKSLEAAIADVAKAEAVLRQSQATKARTDANVVRWKAEFNRVSQIRDLKAASQNDYDIAQEQLHTAEAGVAEARAGIDSSTAALASSSAARVRAEATVAVAKAQIAVAEADARRQREWLKYATVKAPYDGVIFERNVNVGQYVMAPTSGSTQPPLFVIVRKDPVRINVDVPESEAVLIQENMPVVVRIQSRGDLEFPAQVSRLSWALDQSSRTLRVEVDLLNANEQIRPGMFAIVRFATERPAVWVVPSTVVVTTDEQPYAVRVENGKSIKTPVKIGARQGGMVEVLQKQTRSMVRGETIPWESLTGTEEFLATRPAGWTDGMKVTVP